MGIPYRSSHPQTKLRAKFVAFQPNGRDWLWHNIFHRRIKAGLWSGRMRFFGHAHRSPGFASVFHTDSIGRASGQEHANAYRIVVVFTENWLIWDHAARHGMAYNSHCLCYGKEEEILGHFFNFCQALPWTWLGILGKQFFLELKEISGEPICFVNVMGWLVSPLLAHLAAEIFDPLTNKRFQSRKKYETRYRYRPALYGCYSRLTKLALPRKKGVLPRSTYFPQSNNDNGSQLWNT